MQVKEKKLNRPFPRNDRPPYNTPKIPSHRLYNPLSLPSQPSFPSLEKFKIIEFFTGIGQELKSLHKSSHLILTLSRLFSLPRMIEKSQKGSSFQERNSPRRKKTIGDF